MYYAPDEDENYEKPPVGPIFLWGQAVFIIAQLLTSGLLHINELDTIRRYLPSYNRPRKGGRYSAFQVRILLYVYASDELLYAVRMGYLIVASEIHKKITKTEN